MPKRKRSDNGGLPAQPDAQLQNDVLPQVRRTTLPARPIRSMFPGLRNGTTASARTPIPSLTMR